MTVQVPHGLTKAEAMAKIDAGSVGLFDFGSKHVEMTDQKKEWSGDTLRFSLTAKAGFIALPISGTILVDNASATVDCDLPNLAKQFVGEEKVAASVRKRLEAALTDSSPASGI